MTQLYSIKKQLRVEAFYRSLESHASMAALPIPNAPIPVETVTAPVAVIPRSIVHQMGAAQQMVVYLPHVLANNSLTKGGHHDLLL